MHNRPDSLRDRVSAFAGARVAVIGDLMADVYLDAAPDRLSREAPVLVVRHEAERSIPGGAANTAANLLALGAATIPIGVVGNDPAGQMLRQYFGDRGVSAEGVMEQDGIRTISKTRVMVGAEGRSRQQVLRIDREPGLSVSAKMRAQIESRLEALLAPADAIIISDYGYGLIDRALVERVLSLAGSRPVLGDSRYALSVMRGVTLAKPNHVEAEAYVGHPVTTDDDCLRAGRRIREELSLRSLLLTRGNRGMMLLDEGNEPIFIPAADLPGEVTDVSGAGDTVVSVLALALATNASAQEAAELANIGAGVVVGKLGAATVGPDELIAAALRIDKE